jgi:predicted nucleic acid-binding protein
MIVVDTNIIGYLYLTSERSEQAEQAFLKDPHWVAPLLWRSEFRNVLALFLRKKILSLVEIQQIMEDAMQMMHNHEYEVVSVQVLSLVASSSCSAYDCEFVALAKDLKIPLVTVNKQILDQFPDIAIALEAFVAA